MEQVQHNRASKCLPLAASAATTLFGIALLSGLSGSPLDALSSNRAVLFGLLLAFGQTAGGLVAVLGGGLAGMLAYQIGSGSGFVLILRCLADLSGTSLLAFALLLRVCRRPERLLDGTSGVLGLIMAAAVSSLLPALLGAATASLGTTLTAASTAYAAALLSILVGTPSVLFLARIADPEMLRSVRDRGIADVIGTFVAVSGIALFVFVQNGLPLLFLIAPVVLLAAFRLRAAGAVAAVGIVAAVAVTATTGGYGPIAAAPGSTADHMLLMYLFLACCFLGALPVAAVLTQYDRCTSESRALAERFRTVVENVGEVIFQVDTSGTWTYLNPAWTRLTGRSVEESLGQPWLNAISAADRAQFASGAACLFAGEIETLTQSVRIGAAGGPHWVEIFVQACRDQQGVLTGATGAVRDVHAARRREELATIAHHHAEERAREAARLASTDELTGLANRRAFLRQLDREIAAAAEFGWPLSVAMFDIDHFKTVNDCFGHATGDSVLKLVAERAGTVVRSGDLVGRLGGEEFAILMPGATVSDAALVAERLRQAVEAPCLVGQELPSVTISIGLAERVERRSAERLLAVADDALYRAKQEGRNQVRVAA